MKDQPKGIKHEQPDEVPGASIDVTGLLAAGGTVFRSKHREARELRKRARLQHRLVKSGVARKKPKVMV